MTKKIRKTTKKTKPAKIETVEPDPAARAKDEVPVDPDENLKWMTTGRLVLAVLTVATALAVRGWMSARRAG